MAEQCNGRPVRRALVGAAAALLVLSGCATTPPAAVQPLAGTTVASPSASSVPSPVVSVDPAPTSTPSPTRATPPPPADPLAGLSRSAKAKFRACLDRRVGAGSSGQCALLASKRLQQAGFYPWAIPSTINATGANALLNYQRSRGLTPTGTTTKDTWVALATRAHQLPRVLPKQCLTEGVVLCVDQAHRKLTYLRDGRTIRTVRVRLGGYNSHPKTGKWRVFPTANGTWHVYDKQVNPKSKNYGSGAMPYSVMFYPDMYVHYSPGFHSVGYASSSHGCVNVGDLAQAIWIFDHTPIGAKVYVFSPTVAA